jgi:cell division protease FtsH
MLMEARGTVKSLLTGRLEDLHRLAGALLEHETLTGAQIKAVLAGEVLLPPAGNTPSLSSSSSNGGEVKVPEPVAAPEAV